jgi:nucleoside-diphosphate-sugar epimerase
MYVIGGQGYVGSGVVAEAADEGVDVTVVSRTGTPHLGKPSLAWSELRFHIRRQSQPASVVWLLDGAKHAEVDRLAELLSWAPTATHVVLVSTCTVYGDRHGNLCAEDTPLQLLTPHAGVKARCEQMLAGGGLSCCVLRLGALYGVDDRSIRADRIEKWVTQAARDGVVTIPEPSHWRGWLHRAQAARALVRVASGRTMGVFNVASANMTFADAAGTAASLFDARVDGDGKPDLCNYQVDATAARRRGLLDERPAEDLPSCTRAFAATRRSTDGQP